MRKPRARDPRKTAMKPLSESNDDELARALHDSRQLVEPPPDVVDRAIALFEGRAPAPAIHADPPSRTAQALASLRRLVATLDFDSGLNPPLAYGMRSSGDSVRQILFTAEGHDIDLRVTRTATPHRFAISGQVLGPEAAGQVRLTAVRPMDASVTATIDEWGEFVLPAVGSGVYALRFELEDRLIEVPELEIPYPG